MQKIGNITSTADANGEWTNGNVAAGTAPTIIDAAWLNTVQREIANVVTAAGLTLDPANDAQLLAGLKLITGPGRLLGAPKIFTSSGTYTPTAGTNFVIVEVQGGGGGGSGTSAAGASQASLGSGGAGGGYAKSLLAVAVATGKAVTVGSAGIGGGGTGGTAGGNSSFGTLITCSGGQGGYFQTTASLPFGATGVVGGTATGGNIINISGGNSAHSIAPALNVIYASSGGHSVLGEGGFGPGNVNNPGLGASGYGAGGGGGLTQNGSAQLGGNGAKGIVIIWEYS